MDPLSDMLVVFAVSGTRLALAADSVAELVPEPALVRPPTMPPVMAGLFSLRGRIVGVLHLDRLLELPAPAAGPFRALVVLSQGAGGWALLVERIEAVVRTGELAPAPPEIAFDDCVLGLRPMAEGPALVLSAERLLRKREARALEAFAEQARRRWEELSGGDA